MNKLEILEFIRIITKIKSSPEINCRFELVEKLANV